MSDEARLLSGEANDFEKELLGSWKTEQPGDAERGKVLAMVGLSAGVGATVAATKAGAGAAMGGSIAPKAAVGTALLLKWLAVGVAGVILAGSGVAYLRHARGSHAATTSVAPPSVAPAAPAAPAVAAPILAPAPPDPAPTPGEAVGDETPRPASPSLTRSASGASHGSRTPDAALGEQVAALDRARRALAGGDTTSALRQVSDYETRFPHGALVEEAEVLRIEALLASGDRSSAARVGAHFLNAHPESPHASRVRTLLGASPAP